MTEKILDVKNLKMYYYTYEGVVKAVDDISFNINKGESLAIVGESGCGKSSIALSIIRLVPPAGKIVSGNIIFEGKDLLSLSEEEMRRMRGRKIALIFQDPLTALNPLLSAGFQVAEAIQLHKGLSGLRLKSEAITSLKQVKIPDAEKRYYSFPFELSGGMKQRVMIAMATSCNPSLLIADEPTSALDVTIQAEIIELIKELILQLNMSLLFITHDFGLVAELADNIAVMYAGKIVEQGKLELVVKEALHPYTKGLIGCLPKTRKGKLTSITGTVPSLINPPSGCRFHPRCPFMSDKCRFEEPRPVQVKSGQIVLCHLYAEGETESEGFSGG
jgi:oligopeptide/dipeptide ABC transporter ATP-binding protein